MDHSLTYRTDFRKKIDIFKCDKKFVPPCFNKFS